MRIIVMGATGTVGQKVAETLETSEEVIRVGRTSGDLLVDYTDARSVEDMFKEIGSFDALVAAIGGDSVFKPYDELTDDDFRYGFERKVLAQLRLVSLGTPHAGKGGSFTLSSGFLSDYPNPWSTATGPLNAAVNVAVSSIAPLLPNDLRLNVVSAAPIVPDGQEGRGRVTAASVAEAYVESIRSARTGETLRVWGGLEEEHRNAQR
jgi:NAD(P)-dependent dehydrogenase (short-subunit alcohol dehydrogenase family)